MHNIRLTQKYIDVIQNTFKTHFLRDDTLWLFGSRVDLNKKGGDIDLYIETHFLTAREVLNAKSRFKRAMIYALGDQKIDIVLNCLNVGKTNLPIYTVARTEGVRLV